MKLLLIIIVFVIFCIVNCCLGAQLRVPFQFLPKSLLISRECRDLQMYPKTKLVGGLCFDVKTAINGILRGASQCHYNVSGVTPNVIGYGCCTPVVCCPSVDPPINIREQCECLSLFKDFIYFTSLIFRL